MTELVRVTSLKIDFSREDKNELSPKDRKEIERKLRGKVVQVPHPAEDTLCDHLSDCYGWLVLRAEFVKVRRVS